MRASWISSTVVAGLATVALAQEPPRPVQQEQPPVFRTGVNLVRVDVTVNAKGDEPVTDLTIADFAVEEDGVLQNVESFQFVSIDGAAVSGDDTSLAIRSPEHAEAEAAREDVRLFAVFLDDYHLPQYQLNNVMLRKAMTTFFEKEIAPTDLVAVMNPITPISAIGWTRDKQAMLDKIKNYDGMEGNYTKARSPLEEGQLISRDVRRIRAEVTLSALHSLVAYLGTLRDGRKSVLFVSKGPPMVFRDGTMNTLVQDVVRAANQGNVVIHVMDPQGLTGTMFGRDSLYLLANETGGRTIINTNDLTKGLTAVVKDASAYYLLGYQPAHPLDDGKVHKIDVKVKRKGVRVLARKGYAAPPPVPERTMAMPEAAPEVRTAMTSLAESKSGRSASLWVGQHSGTDGATLVRFSWTPSAKSSVARAVRLDLSVLRADKTSAGETSIATAGSEAPQLPLAPGQYTLQVTTFDQEGEATDRWTEPLDVTDFTGGRLALATPEVFVAHSAPELRQVVAGTATPTSAREYRRTDRMIVRGESVGGAEPALKAELLNQSGAVLVTLPVRAIEGRRYELEVPLASLAQGSYVLRVQAASAAETDAKLVAFRVVP